LLKKILKNSILTALIRGSSFGVRIGALLIAAHFSGPAAFGTIALFFTIAEIARLVADFGVDTYTMRGYALSRNKLFLAETIRAASSAKVTLGALTAVIGSALMLTARPDAGVLVLPFTLMIVSPLIMNLPVNYFIAKMRGKHVGFFIAATGGVSLVVFSGCYTLSSGAPECFLVIPLTEALVGAVLIGRVPILRQSVLNVDLAGMGRLLKTAAPIGAATVLGIAYGRMDVFFLEKFRSVQELGLYSFSVRLVEPFQFVAGALAVNAYSHISSSVQAGAGEGMATNSRYRKVMGIYAVFAFFIVVLVANFAVDRVFPAYRDTTTLLIIAGATLAVKCGNLVTTSAIQAHGRFKFITLIAFWNFCFLAAAMMLLVPRFGSYGALAAVFAMELVNFTMQNFYLHKLLGRSLISD
jgi:O-antigen/teichoic acid export membrane protein